MLPEQIKKLSKTEDGYLRAKVGNKARLIHTVVLETFVGQCPKGMQACHNNGNPEDNRLSNLRWDTPKSNVRDRLSHGTYQYGIKNPHARYTDQQILDVYNSDLPPKEKADKYGVRLSTVYLIQCGVYPRLIRLMAQERRPLGSA